MAPDAIIHGPTNAADLFGWAVTDDAVEHDVPIDWETGDRGTPRGAAQYAWASNNLPFSLVHPGDGTGASFFLDGPTNAAYNVVLTNYVPFHYLGGVETSDGGAGTNKTPLRVLTHADVAFVSNIVKGLQYAMPDAYEARSAAYWPTAWSNGAYGGHGTVTWTTESGWEADLDDFFIVPSLSDGDCSPAEIVDGDVTNSAAEASGTWPNVYTYTHSPGEGGWVAGGEDWGHWSDTNILRYFADDMGTCLASGWKKDFELSFTETHEVSGTAVLSSAVTNWIPVTNGTDGTVTTNEDIVRTYDCTFTNYACTVSGDDCGVLREFPYTTDVTRFASNISRAFVTGGGPKYIGRCRAWIDTNDWQTSTSSDMHILANASWSFFLTNADFTETGRNGLNVAGLFQDHCTSVTNYGEGYPDGVAEGDVSSCAFSRTVKKTLSGLYYQRTGTVTLPDAF
jgi:hypothetical protein